MEARLLWRGNRAPDIYLGGSALAKPEGGPGFDSQHREEGRKNSSVLWVEWGAGAGTGGTLLGVNLNTSEKNQS